MVEKPGHDRISDVCWMLDDVGADQLELRFCFNGRLVPIDIVFIRRNRITYNGMAVFPPAEASTDVEVEQL